MRFSTISTLALPLLAAATQQESPLDQLKTQAQFYFDKISAFLPSIPNPNKAHGSNPVDAATAKVGGKALSILTLDNWKNTLYSSVKPSSSTPEEWWVLVTGGNKTCFGHCGNVEKAFNQSAAIFAAVPTAPHLALLNCDNQPVLCNSWAAGPPNLYIMHIAAPPAPVDIRIVHLNATTIDVKDITDLQTSGSWKEKPLYEGYFHPFDGPLAQYGLALPLGYIFWIFSVVPSWLFMIGVSFISRNIMSKRTLGPQPGAGAPRAAGAPPAAAR